MSDKEKLSIVERVQRALDIPPDVISRECMIELRGRSLVTVHGCLRISRYLPSEIRLRTASGEVVIVGESLLCVSFASGCVGIEGRVEGVSFAEAEI